MAERRFSPSHLAGGLLLLASGVLAASAIPNVSPVVETMGFALFATAIAALADLHLRSRRFGAVLVIILLVAIGDRLADHAVSVDRPWAVPAALGGFLLWTAVVRTPRAVLIALAPALVATALPIAFRDPAANPLLLSLPLLPVALVAALLALPRGRARDRRSTLDQNQIDLDAVIMANVELRHAAEARDAAQRIARIATELLVADGAVVWLQGPGNLMCAGGHGLTPAPDRDVTEGSAIERVLTTGSIASDPEAGEIVLPLTASGGVFGAVIVNGATRPAESFVTSVLQVFGAQAGYALERLRAVESLIDARFVDPITGVGNRLAATSSLATLHPGDAVLLLAVDELDTIRAIEGDGRADLVLGQLGLHLRTATRAGDLVARFGDDVFFVMLRDLNSSAESVVGRLLESWQKDGSAGYLRAGAALHFADTSPLDTLDRANEALDATRIDHRNPIGVAAERAAWGPA